MDDSSFDASERAYFEKNTKLTPKFPTSGFIKLKVRGLFIRRATVDFLIKILGTISSECLLPVLSAKKPVRPETPF